MTLKTVTEKTKHYLKYLETQLIKTRYATVNIVLEMNDVMQ